MAGVIKAVETLAVDFRNFRAAPASVGVSQPHTRTQQHPDTPQSCDTHGHEDDDEDHGSDADIEDEDAPAHAGLLNGRRGRRKKVGRIATTRTFDTNTYNVSQSSSYGAFFVDRESQRQIQDHTNLLLGRKRTDPIDIQKLPSERELRGWDGVTAACCVEDFRPDFRDEPGSLWNQSVADTFVQDFILHATPLSDDPSKARVAYLKYFKNLKKRLKHQSVDMPIVETRARARYNRKYLVSHDITAFDEPEPNSSSPSLTSYSSDALAYASDTAQAILRWLHPWVSMV